MEQQRIDKIVKEMSKNLEDLMNFLQENSNTQIKDPVKCLEGYLKDALKDFNTQRVRGIKIYHDPEDKNTIILDYKKPTGDNIFLKINYTNEDNKNKISITPDRTKLNTGKIMEYINEINTYLESYILNMQNIKTKKEIGLELLEFSPEILNEPKIKDFLEEYAENPKISKETIKNMFYNGDLQKIFDAKRAVYDENRNRIFLEYETEVCYPKKAIVLELGEKLNIFYSGFEEKEINEKIFNSFEEKDFPFVYKQTLLKELSNKSKLKTENLKLNTGFKYLYLKGKIIFGKENFYSFDPNKEITIILDKNKERVEKIIGVNKNNIEDALKIMQLYFTRSEN